MLSVRPCSRRLGFQPDTVPTGKMPVLRGQSGRRAGPPKVHYKLPLLIYELLQSKVNLSPLKKAPRDQLCPGGGLRRPAKQVRKKGGNPDKMETGCCPNSMRRVADLLAKPALVKTGVRSQPLETPLASKWGHASMRITA